jgi:hypothetical protein
VDYPAIAFPSGLTVDQELDCLSKEEAAAYVPLSEDDRLMHDGCKFSAASSQPSSELTRSLSKLADHPKKYINAPLSLQLIAMRCHDEELMDALAKVEAILKRSR